LSGVPLPQLIPAIEVNFTIFVNESFIPSEEFNCQESIDPFPTLASSTVSGKREKSGGVKHHIPNFCLGKAKVISDK